MSTRVHVARAACTAIKRRLTFVNGAQICNGAKNLNGVAETTTIYH